MSTPIYSMKSGRLSFADKMIFDKLEFYIYKKDRICLIGSNGAGKSSFLKVITDIYQLDSGQIYKHPNLSISYLEQEAQINSENTFERLLSLDSIVLSQSDVEIIVNGLQVDFDKPLKNLSGGQKRRAALALALVKMPDILLLDEPTNHLDINAIQWLESYILNYSGAVICISHDRSFLSNVTNKILWLDRASMRSMDKGFSHFDQWRDQIIAQEELELLKLNKKLDVENIWLQQGVTARRKRNQGRLAELKNLRKEIQQKNLMQNALNNKINIISAEQKKSRFIIEAEDITFGYDDKILIKNFNIRVIKGERIGIIGANGSGKSTFIKLLVKEIAPTSGNVKHGQALDITYLDQHRETIDPNLTLAEFLCNGGADNIQLTDGSIVHIATYLKNFMFDAKMMHAKISTLSGGQANRLLLAKALIKPGNLLILDEPTNDLDMESLEMLIEILYEYQGTLIVISHDRDFLNRLSTRTLIFVNNEIKDLVGGVENYTKFLTTNNLKTTIKNIINKGPAPKNKSFVSKLEDVPTKLSYHEQRILDMNLSQIDKLEKEVLSIEHILTQEEDLYTKDFLRFKNLTDTLDELHKKIAGLSDEWMRAQEKLDLINKTKNLSRN